MSRRKERLYMRGAGRWYAELRDLGGGREAMILAGESFATKERDLAAIILAGRIKELEEARRNRHYSGLSRTASMGKFAGEWLDYMSATDLRQKTLERYQLALKHAFLVLDDARPMDSLSLSDVKRALGKLRACKSRYGKPLSGSSVRHVIVAMRNMYAHAITEGVVAPDRNPWMHIAKRDRPRVKRSDTEFLEVYEAAAIIEAAGRIRTRYIPLRPLVATFLLTGGRLAEVLGLEVSDIDFERGVVRIRENKWRPLKRGHGRDIPLWPQLATELRSYLSSRGRIGGLLFPGMDREGVEKRLYGKVYSQIKAAAVLAGVSKKVTPQVFRVTYCAARLQTLDRGEPVAGYTVQRELGHSSMDMIDRVYGRLGRERHRSVVVEYVPQESAAKPESEAKTG